MATKIRVTIISRRVNPVLLFNRLRGWATAYLGSSYRIPHAVPAALASDLYADASHPLADGYRVLADRLYEDESFRRFLEGQE